MVCGKVNNLTKNKLEQINYSFVQLNKNRFDIVHTIPQYNPVQKLKIIYKYL